MNIKNIWKKLEKLEMPKSDQSDKDKLIPKMIKCSRYMPETTLIFYPVGPIPHWVHWPSQYNVDRHQGVVQIPSEFYDSHLNFAKARVCFDIMTQSDKRWINWQPVDLTEYPRTDLTGSCPWCDQGYVRQLRFVSLVGQVSSHGKLDSEVKIIDIPSSLYNEIAILMDFVRKEENITEKIFTSLDKHSPWREKGIPCFMIRSNGESGRDLRYLSFLSRKSIPFEEAIDSFDQCGISWGDLASFIDPTEPRCDPPVNPSTGFDPFSDDDPFANPFDEVF